MDEGRGKQMAYSIHYEAEEGYLAVTVQGRLDVSAANELIAGIVRAAQENDCYKVLSDYREAELELSLVDLFDVPALIASQAASSGVDPHWFKRALIVAGDLGGFSFYETVSRNRSQNIRVFHDYDEAKTWLLGS